MNELFFLCLLFCFLSAPAQTPFRPADSTAVKRQVDSINRLIDRAVVNKQSNVLQQHYAGDFVFTHGTGLIDSKASWLKNVLDTATHFLSREHDSTSVEWHNDVAVVTGILTVRRQQPEQISRYGLRYVRVYQFRKGHWQLLSHRTTSEWHYD